MELWNRCKQALIKVSATGLITSWAINASAVSPQYYNTEDPYSGVQTAPFTPFNPLLSAKDYMNVCGDYQVINQNDIMQGTSRSWQRCYAYTSATISTMGDMERTTPIKQFCVPENVSTEYAIELAVRYIKKIPDTWSENPAKIILEALAVRYPCQEPVRE